MARLTAGDVKEILQTLEDGLRYIPKLGKTEKRAIRSKIRRQFAWLSEQSSLSAGMVLHELEQKLPDVFPQYPYGFAEQFKDLLSRKLKE
jgi:hypothetical protein